MTVKEAAHILGYNVGSLQNLIRTGKVQATKVQIGTSKYTYDISEKEVNRLNKQPKPENGWPRGKPRSVEDKESPEDRAKRLSTGYLNSALVNLQRADQILEELPKNAEAKACRQVLRECTKDLKSKVIEKVFKF